MCHIKWLCHSPTVRQLPPPWNSKNDIFPLSSIRTTILVGLDVFQSLQNRNMAYRMLWVSLWMETWREVLQNERNLESFTQSKYVATLHPGVFSQVSFSLIHPFIQQLLGTYYILSPVPRLEDKNIMMTGTLQSRTHSLACEKHEPVNN